MEIRSRKIRMLPVMSRRRRARAKADRNSMKAGRSSCIHAGTQDARHRCAKGDPGAGSPVCPARARREGRTRRSSRARWPCARHRKGAKMERNRQAAGRARRTQPATARLAETVYERIKSDLFERRLMPGERFSQNEEARPLGVSRTPGREARFQLGQEGYIRVASKSGWK